MVVKAPELTVGIEEEYLLVDPATRDLAIDPPPQILEECQRRVPDQIVTPEFLRSQIEIGTRVCGSVKEAQSALTELRRNVADVVREHGLALVAASTHPFAAWQDQKPTARERYEVLARDMQATARRLLICGMHVHAAISDEDLRIDLMNQVTYFLPHLLALTTSSPFWQGEESGLMSYRLSVFDGLPRTGVPDYFNSYGEYERLVTQMVSAGLIEDATKLWWDIRPSDKYPTLEMRMTDVCTRLDDAVTVAALYVCLLRWLYRLRASNQRWRIYPSVLIAENRWLAQRHSCTGSMVDFGMGEQVPYANLLEEVIALVAEDAEALDCVEEVKRSRDIVARGTSAHRQLAVFREAKENGADNTEAMRQVVDMLIEDTLLGTGLEN